ncbi:MAG: ABC transporter ATP-binding protein [Bdellovibrionales bacterium]|nr:ABC transporter ATP-binding protein [Bdellovibrionales bacterium]
MKSVIEATNLIKSYNSFHAVNGLSFQVHEGECFGLLGPNGAGKSSTFKMMYGSARISEGDLYILGLNAKLHMSKIKALIGVVPQENGLDPDFSVMDNLLIYGNYFRLPKLTIRNRAMELLAMMQLEDHAEKQIEQLSGGMKRRLVLARALLSKPKLIFLDEPTTGLDPQARGWIWDELRALQKSGTTLVLTTHYMEEAEVLCDRLLIMNNGQMMAEGSPDDLILNHVGKEVIEFEVSPKEIEYFIQKIEGKFVYQVMRAGLKLFLRGDQTPRDAINEISSPNITMRKASLNDVFLKISGNELND